MSGRPAAVVRVEAEESKPLDSEPDTTCGASCDNDRFGDPVLEGRCSEILRAYARIAGVILLAVAAAGLVIFGWETVSVFFHAGVSLLFLYVGFSRLEAVTVRQMVGGLGMLLVVVKVITIVTPLMWGGPPQHGPVEATCLVVGISSILAARYLRNGRSS